MPSFSTEVPHSLGQQAAREKLESFLDTLREKYKDQVSGLEGEWQDDVLTYKLTTFGITIKGRISVESDKVRVDGDIPFAALMFKGKIVDGIKDALTQALN